VKTGFKEHLAFGFISLLLAFAFAAYFSSVSSSELLFASFIFLTASVLPDADAPFSFVRRGLRVLFTSVFFVIALFLAFYFQNPLSAFCPAGNAACFWATLAFTLILPFVLIELIDFMIPGHRGPLHSLSAGIVFGLFCLALTSSFLAGLFAFLGYFSHLLLDFFGSPA